MCTTFNNSFVKERLTRGQNQELGLNEALGYVLCRSCAALAETKFGGAKRDRTADLLRAKQALSQLS